MVDMDNVRQMLAQGDEQTLSLYLDVDAAKQENQAAQPAWRITLKDAIHEIEPEAKNSDGWRLLKERFDAFFDGYEPDTKGLAAFFTPTSEQIYELPLPVESRWSFGKPLVAPLLWAID